MFFGKTTERLNTYSTNEFLRNPQNEKLYEFYEFLKLKVINACAVIRIHKICLIPVFI